MNRIHNVVFVVGAPGAGKTTALRMMALPSDLQVQDSEVRWTIRKPSAFIGNYENKILDGGDRVARHANLLSLEYWKRYILPCSDIKVTFLDGEMYLWSRILESLQGSLEFVRKDEEHYIPGGRYFKTFDQIVSRDHSRFPQILDEQKEGSPSVEVRVSCIYLYVSPEVSLQRRRAREANAEAGATINSDRHMQVAGSKQRNFANKFKESSSPFFLPENDALDYLEFNVEKMSPVEVVEEIERFVKGLR